VSLCHAEDVEAVQPKQREFAEQIQSGTEAEFESASHSEIKP